MSTVVADSWQSHLSEVLLNEGTLLLALEHAFVYEERKLSTLKEYFEKLFRSLSV